MARRTAPRRGMRNTAPMWKKIVVVLSAPVAMLIVIKLLHTNTWNFFLFALVVLVAAVAAVWVTAKVLGVHLSLGSWD